MRSGQLAGGPGLEFPRHPRASMAHSQDYVEPESTGCPACCLIGLSNTKVSSSKLAPMAGIHPSSWASFLDGHDMYCAPSYLLPHFKDL